MNEAPDSPSHCFVVGVAGGSASGKSTLAAALRDSFGEDRTEVLALDRYYLPLDHLSLEQRARTNFDAPEALDLELFVTHLRTLRSGTPVDLPEYCFRSHQRLPSSRVLRPRELLIVEGVLLLDRPEIRAHLDLELWIEVEPDDRRERRRKRDVRERGRSLEQVDRQWREHVRPMEERHEQRSRARAGHVLDGRRPQAVLVAEVRAIVEAARDRRSL